MQWSIIHYTLATFLEVVVADIVITHQDDEEKSLTSELRVLQLELKINQRQPSVKEYEPSLSEQKSAGLVEAEAMRLSNHTTCKHIHDAKTYKADVKDTGSIEGQSGIDGERDNKTRQSEMVRQWDYNKRQLPS